MQRGKPKSTCCVCSITRNNNVKLSGKGKDKGKPQKPAKWAQQQTRAYKQAASELRARIRDEYKADTYSTELHSEVRQPDAFCHRRCPPCLMLSAACSVPQPGSLPRVRCLGSSC